MAARLSLFFAFTALVARSVADAEPKTSLPLPDANTVVRQFVNRAAFAESNRFAGAFTYYRTNITEEFSRKGELTKHEELLLRVTVEKNAQQLELVSINGRQPSASEVEQQLKRFGAHREDPARREKPDRSRQMESFINMEILGRYAFTVQGRELIEGRDCLMLTFKPREGLSDSGKLFERVLNQMGGILWIDEREHELVKADIQLRERISLWGGFLGALERMHLKILRHREPGGRWRDKEVDAQFVGRAVTRHIDVETHDYSSLPQPLTAVPVVAAQ